MKYYINQSIEIKVTVVFDNPDLTLDDAESVFIGVATPNGVKTVWPTVANGEVIIYDVPADTLTQKGKYRVWGEAVFAGSPPFHYYTESTEMELFNQGE